jgi:transposase
VAGNQEVIVERSYDRLFVGIDWATEAHQICVVNERNEVVEERTIQHSGPAVAECIGWLIHVCGGDSGRVWIGIEVPRGALVEMLIEHGFLVYAINPKQLDRFRDRHFPAGAKDDRRDAYVLATSLRTDVQCFHCVRTDEPAVIRLRDLSRLDDELRLSFNRHCCQLREQLQRYYPQILEMSSSANEPWIWSLLEIAPTPEAAAKLTPARVEKLLRHHRIRRVDARTVVDTLLRPGFQLVRGTVEAASEHALMLVPHLRLLHTQRAELGRKMEAVLEQISSSGDAESDQPQHRDVELILSLPGVGRVVAATMLAEASQPLGERDYHALRAYGGIAPITRQSGKKSIVLMRQGCNGRLRNALYHWSRVSVQHDAVSREHYARLRSVGHTHGRALRGVTDRLLAVLIAMLKSGQPYDPSRRHAATQSTAVHS